MTIMNGCESIGREALATSFLAVVIYVKAAPLFKMHNTSYSMQ